MKETLSLILALVMCLSLCACSSGNNAPAKSSKLKVGDKATGQLFDITVQSVETIDKIENGYVWHIWSPWEETIYKDVTAEEGYTIYKIVCSYQYTGKKNGVFPFELSLDYDNGYTFYDLGGHALPAIDNSVAKSGFEESYDDGECYICIDDSLSFEGGEIVKYIIVNDQVLTNTDKAFILKVDVPTSSWEYEKQGLGWVLVAQSEPETFIYNLR